MSRTSTSRWHFTRMGLEIMGLGVGLIMVGCITVVPTNTNDNTNGQGEPFNNTTDRTNKGATYIGADACRACHAEINETQSVHGHGQKLKPIDGQPPVYPEAGIHAGVPDTPEGFDWDDVAFVIGGYTKKGRFVDQDGYVLTTGLTGVATQWNLDFPPNGTVAGWANYEPDAEAQKPYDYSCFVCHTTGAMPQDEDFPRYVENRPGMGGSFEEAGVQCEACHGPGSNHVQNTSARDLYVNRTATLCGECHDRPFNNNGAYIQAAGGFIMHHEQYPELRASGAHANFDCLTCHKAHVSVTYDRDNAMTRECLTCHPNHNLGLHEGYTFVRGDYSEVVSCESCHMPYTAKSATSATVEVAGDTGRIGDTRGHIFRINTEEVNYTSFFNEDGSRVAVDDEGRAAVTLDFVCLRCHNGIGNAFDLSLGGASGIAGGYHDR